MKRKLMTLGNNDRRVPTAFRGFAVMLATAGILAASCTRTATTPVAPKTEGRFVLDNPFAFLQHGDLDPALYHAQALADGDYRRAACSWEEIPYHLDRLIQLRECAAPFLVQLLRCRNITPIDIRGNEIALRGMRPITASDRKATVADLADYALRRIYTPNMVVPCVPVDEFRIRYWEDVIGRPKGVDGPKGSGVNEVSRRSTWP